MSVVGGLLSAYGGRQRSVANLYKPVGKNIRDYERLQHEAVTGLFDANAYDQPGLGYNEQEMQGMYGEGRDLIAGERAGETQRTADRFRSPGGYGLRSAMYARAQQRSDLAGVSRANELKRRMIVDNARLKRADVLARLAAVTGAYEMGTGLYNARKGARAASENARTNAIWSGLAEAGASAEKYATMGFGGMAVS